jgi:hypothetical protein
LFKSSRLCFTDDVIAGEVTLKCIGDCHKKLSVSDGRVEVSESGVYWIQAQFMMTVPDVLLKVSGKPFTCAGNGIHEIHRFKRMTRCRMSRWFELTAGDEVKLEISRTVFFASSDIHSSLSIVRLGNL